MPKLHVKINFQYERTYVTLLNVQLKQVFNDNVPRDYTKPNDLNYRL